MKYTTTYENHPTTEDIQVLSNGITSYAVEKKFQKPLQPFAFFIRDEDGKIRGGCNGVLLYGCMHVDQLWIEEPLRKKGYGTQLMQAVEKLAKENECQFLSVNTMSWEALDFYKKLGFEVDLARHGYANDSIFYFLRKNL
jgi:GNAT superfamily N-acetyltransferase